MTHDAPRAALRSTAVERRRSIAPLATWVAAMLMTAGSARAQERLVGTRALGAGMSYESISFGGEGIPQSGFAGLDSTRLTKVQQLTLPITTAVPIGRGWRMDVTALYSHGRITYTDRAAPGGTRTASLGGVSDVRLRASGRVWGDGLILTVGLNAPTGRTALSASEFATLRVLGASALGMGSTSVGSGPSGTLGLVVPHQVGKWALAYGGSYELRGRYQPLAALTVGASTADFTPGGVIRASLTGDRTLGAHRLIVALAADVFAQDKLTSDIATDAAGRGGPNVASVQLGPVLSADAQLQIAAPRVRELLAYTAYRWRAPFARDGLTVAHSSGQYVDAGARTVLPWAAGRDVVISTDARWHSGLGVDLGLPTAGVRSAMLTVGVNLRRSLTAVQPYVRAQGGVLSQRTPTGNKPSRSFTGAGLGLVISSRF